MGVHDGVLQGHSQTECTWRRSKQERALRDDGRARVQDGGRGILGRCDGRLWGV